MRRLLLALCTMFLMAGLVVAVEVTVVSVDKDKKEITVKEGDAEKTYKIDPKGKFTTTDLKGENSKEADFDAFVKYAGSKGGKDKKSGRKIDVTVKDGTITEATWKTFTKKGKN
jgi:hypothetical protein